MKRPGCRKWLKSVLFLLLLLALTALVIKLARAACGTPAVSLSPNNVAFGSINIGSNSSSQAVSLSNTGTAPFAINSISIAGAGPGNFLQSNTCGSALVAGSRCTITVTFSPSMSIGVSASLVVATSASGSPSSIPLAGTGVWGNGGITFSTADYVYPASQTYYNVRNFGAIGDGVHDDTAAIQTAFVAAYKGTGSQNHGFSPGTLYFPSGEYLISQPIAEYTTPSMLGAGSDANVTATVSTGCITGFNVVSGGSGYMNSFDIGGGNTSAGLWITGGGGSGAKLQWAMLSGGSVSSINMHGVSCIGQGYTSAPTVKVVNWRDKFRIEGQNKSNTTIKFVDNSPYFSNANCNASLDENQARQNCQPMIMYANNVANSTGASESGYTNDMWNITIDTGSSNPGAIAVRWDGSNRASIRNVNIVAHDGQGRAGLDLSANNVFGGGGPAYVKNVSVRGFDMGIDLNSGTHEVGHTLEYIDLENQHVAGVVNASFPNWFRGVSSTNSVPAFVNCKHGSSITPPYYCANFGGTLEVIDGTFSGGSSSTSAILMENNQTGDGVSFFRNITTTGYQSALALTTAHTVVPGSSISEFDFPAAMSQFASPLVSLNLPVPQTPEVVDNNFSDWADVGTFGANCLPNTWNDATSCIQAAMNSGKPFVYFPQGQYNISATIHIPSTVQKVVGSASYIICSCSRLNSPTFSVDSTSSNVVQISAFNLDVATTSGISYNGTAPLVLSDVWSGGGTFTNTNLGTGTIYLEDFPWVAVNVSLVSGQALYAHQLDLENGTNPHFRNNGVGTDWIFGYKTEGTGPIIGTGTATTELLGAIHFCNSGNQPFVQYTFANNSASSISASMSPDCWTSGLVQETRAGVTNVLPQNGNSAAGNGIGLYSGHN